MFVKKDGKSTIFLIENSANEKKVKNIKAPRQGNKICIRNSKIEIALTENIKQPKYVKRILICL